MFNFHQATNETTPFWEAIGDLLSTPSPDQIKCQSPKPILLDLAGIERPYQWDAEVVPIQLLRVGETFFIAAVPAEFTTMAGRRLKAAIASRIVDHAEALGDALEAAGEACEALRSCEALRRGLARGGEGSATQLASMPSCSEA